MSPAPAPVARHAMLEAFSATVPAPGVQRNTGTAKVHFSLGVPASPLVCQIFCLIIQITHLLQRDGKNWLELPHLTLDRCKDFVFEHVGTKRCWMTEMFGLLNSIVKCIVGNKEWAWSTNVL